MSTARWAVLGARVLTAGRRLLLALGVCTAVIAFRAPSVRSQTPPTSAGGPGYFQAAINYSEGGVAPGQVSIAHLDGDGINDMLTLDTGGGGFDGVRFFHGNGDGTFAQGIFSGIPLSEPRALAVGDVDGDGKLDAIVAADCIANDCTQGAVTVLLNNGNGTFSYSQERTYLFGGSVSQGNTLTIADLDQDGKLDFVVGIACYGSCSTGALGIYHGNGNGTFSNLAVRLTAGNGAMYPVIADFNSDGIPDIIAGSAYSAGGTPQSSLTAVWGLGRGNFSQSVVLPISLPNALSALVVIDFNSDHQPDLAIAYSSPTLQVLIGDGQGNFQIAVTDDQLTNNLIDHSNAISVADLNGDGKEDLIVSGVLSGFNGFQVFLNDGVGNLYPGVNYTAGGFFGAFTAVADLNGDSKADVVLVSGAHQDEHANRWGGTYTVFLAKGDGTFRSAKYNWDYAQGGPASVAAGRFIGGPPPDLVYPDGTGFGLLPAPGNSGLSVPFEYPSPVQGTARTLAVDDFDHDGRPDVAIGNDSSSVIVFLNSGNGNFQPARVVDAGTGALAMVTGDFNGDGNRDVALLNVGAVSVLLGDGQGGFQQAILTPVDGSASWIAAADLNHDGHTDLVVSQSVIADSRNYDGVQVFLSNGNGTFTPKNDPYLSGGVPDFGTSTVTLGDVNGDGIPDIVVGNFCDSGIVYPACRSGAIGVLLGRPEGDGTFLPVSTYNVPDGNLMGISLADVNGDGKLDVVASTLTGVAVAFGNGDGTFQAATVYAALRAEQNVQLAIADLNNDGSLDIVQPGVNSQVAILFNHPQATVAVPTVTSITAPPISFGNSASVTVSVTSTQGTVTGNVSLRVDANPSLTQSQSLSNGSAVFTISGLSLGSHSLSASYAAQGSFAASAASAALEVNPAATATTVTSSRNPATAGELLTFTAVVAKASGPVPTGSVTFDDGATALASVTLDAAGQAIYSTFSLAPGTHSITAQYSGDSDSASSVSAVLSQVVNNLILPGNTTITLYDRPNGTGNIVMTYTGPMLNPGLNPVTVPGFVLNPSVMQWSTPPVPADDQPGSMNPCSAATGNGGPNGEATISCFSQAPGTTNGVPLFSFCFQGVQWPMPPGTYNADGPNHSACGNYFVAHTQIEGAGFAFAFLDSASIVVAQAPQTLTVTSLADDNSQGTLRYQMGAANPGDIITFAVTGTITLTQGQLRINKKLTINGSGSGDITVSGNNSSTVFLVDPGVTASISGITIANGNSIQNGNGGGGIWNKGDLTISNVFFTNNSTGCNCNSGGGIRNDGNLVVARSTFSQNSAGYGGGIGNWGTLTLKNSTFAKNGATFGGGVFSASTATVTNTTFYNNGAGQSGPGMDGSGAATLKGSLFANNSFTDGLGNPYAPGSCTAIISAGYNLSDDNSCSAFLNNTGDRNNTAAGVDVGGLKDNGGSTPTVALLSASPAVDAIAVSPCTDPAGNGVADDQRGITRPQGTACDIGAFERVPGIATTTSLSSSANPSIFNQPVTFTATITPAAGSAAPTGFVTFTDGAATLGTVPLTGSGQAVYSTSSLTQGGHSILATYTGDVAFDGSAANPLPQDVNLIPTDTTISAPTITYGNTATVTVSVSSAQDPVIGNVSLAVDNGTPTTKSLSNGAAVFSLSGLGGGSHGLSAHYAAQGNFAASSRIGAQQVDPATTSISISNIPTKATFGGSFVPIYAYAGDGAKSVTSGTPTTCAVSGTVVNFVGVGTCTLTAHATATANYAAANGSSQPFAIAQATPTISINNLPLGPKVGGSFQPTYAYTGDGTTSTTSSAPAVCTVSGTVVNFVGVGTCSLTAHATATPNSAAATGQLQSFSIGQGTPTINISNIPGNAVFGGSFTPTYAYSGNGKTSTTSSTTAICTVSGKGVVSFVGAGTCTLAAHATATANYAAVNGAAQSFSIAQATTAISIKNIPNTAKRGGSFMPTYNYAGDGSPSTVSSTPAVCTVSGSTVSFIASGTCTLKAQASAGSNYAATVGNPQSFAIK
jgi:hypothetical protein